MEEAVSLLMRAIFFSWLWLEFSGSINYRFKLPTLPRRLLNQGTLDCLAIYLILLYFLQATPITKFIHIIFLPFLLLDVFLLNRNTRLQIYFWVELFCILALVLSGLKIAFVSDPRGGFFLLEKSQFLVSFFWMIFLVSLIHLFNVVEGLLYGICLVLNASFLVGIFAQPRVHPEALPLTLVCLSFSFMLWLFTALREKNCNNALCLSSSLSLLIGVVSVITTSKRMALITLSTTLGFFIIPVIFFGFVIYFTHFHYKIRRYQDFLMQPQFLWRFTTSSVNAFVVLACSIEIFILMVSFLFENKVWSFGLTLFALIMFSRFARQIFIKSHIRYKDIVFPRQDHIEMFGTLIFRGEKQRAIELVDQQIQTEGFDHLVTPDALCLFRTVQDRKFGNILRKAFMAIPDGAGVLWASIFLKERPIIERIPGIEFTYDLCNLCQEKNYPVYFLGAKDEALQGAIAVMKEKFPGLILAGSRNGYFKPDEEDQVIERINQSGAKVLFVALGVPNQEYFIDRNRHKFKVSLAMGIGGSLDVISGNLQRSPKFFQDYGLEWFYRTMKEPWRISRILNLPLYILAVLRLKLRQGDHEEEKLMRPLK